MRSWLGTNKDATGSQLANTPPKAGPSNNRSSSQPEHDKPGLTSTNQDPRPDFTTDHDAYLASQSISSRPVEGIQQDAPSAKVKTAAELELEQLRDPFDGSVLGPLVRTRAGSVNAANEGEDKSLLPERGQSTGSDNIGAPPVDGCADGAAANAKARWAAESQRTEALWGKLGEVLILQGEVSRMHLDMEGIGGGDGKGKAKPKAKPKPDTGDGGGEEHDDAGVGVAGEIDEEEERNRVREDEFARLADQFAGRKDAISGIMDVLGKLSNTLTEFHALQAPNIGFPSAASPPATSSSPLSISIYTPTPAASPISTSSLPQAPAPSFSDATLRTPVPYSTTPNSGSSFNSTSTVHLGLPLPMSLSRSAPAARGSGSNTASGGSSSVDSHRDIYAAGGLSPQGRREGLGRLVIGSSALESSPQIYVESPASTLGSMRKDEG